MILYTLNHAEADSIIITEETRLSNDGKLFKKIPTICDILEIKHQSITEWFSSNRVEVSWSHSAQ
jgi:hypothetical protein